MKIFIRDSKGDSFPINIMESDTVAELRKQFREKYNVTVDIDLVFNGAVLEDSDSVFDLDIKEGNTIDYLGHFKAGLYE